MLYVSCSLKDILYRKRMERELLRAKGLLKGAEKPPDEVWTTANSY
jgi:translation initiation factor 3 subunit G